MSPLFRKWWRKMKPEPRAIILMYHRVDEPTCDPWQLSVSPAHFEQQLRQLRQNWRPTSLAELVQDIKSGTVRKRSVALTFDDGYLDNFIHAKPLLEKYGIPATFFVTTKNYERQLSFWWDELQTLILETPHLPERLTLSIATESFTFEIGPESTLTPSLLEKHKTWLAAEDISAPTLRCQLYYDVWRRLRPLPDDEQQNILAVIRQWANLSANLNGSPVRMESHQLQSLASHSLFSIGAHTVTHPALAEHPAQMQLGEIRESRQSLEKMLGCSVKFFAYPYGSYNSDSVTIVKEENFEAAVTTHEGVVTRSSNPWKLCRYQVNNWDGKTFEAKINSWFKKQENTF